MTNQYIKRADDLTNEQVAAKLDREYLRAFCGNLCTYNDRLYADAELVADGWNGGAGMAYSYDYADRRRGGGGDSDPAAIRQLVDSTANTLVLESFDGYDGAQDYTLHFIRTGEDRWTELYFDHAAEAQRAEWEKEGAE